MSENYTGWTVTRDEGDGTLLLQSPAGHVVRLSIEMRSVISLEKEMSDNDDKGLENCQRIKALEAAITTAIGYYVEWCDSDVDDGFDDCPDFVSEMVAELREVNE